MITLARAKRRLATRGGSRPRFPASMVRPRTEEPNAEIANGRLAKVAIIGMLCQDGLTGPAWGN